ncbi:MAG: hypothetical protein R2911_05805 [Caldilineaceae bacterium]
MHNGKKLCDCLLTNLLQMGCFFTAKRGKPARAHLFHFLPRLAQQLFALPLGVGGRIRHQVSPLLGEFIPFLMKQFGFDELPAGLTLLPESELRSFLHARAWPP